MGRELEAFEQEIKAAMLTTAPVKVLALLKQLMREMCEKANAPCEEEAAAAPEEPKDQVTQVPEQIRQQVQHTMEQMRLDHLPQKFKQVDWTQARVDLSCARLKDPEMAQIAAALAANHHITNLDLSHNEFSDIGVQQLVTALAMGGAIGMKELRIVSNSYGAMGQNMLAGLGTMRKGM